MHSYIHTSSRGSIFHCYDFSVDTLHDDFLQGCDFKSLNLIPSNPTEYAQWGKPSFLTSKSCQSWELSWVHQLSQLTFSLLICCIDIDHTVFCFRTVFRPHFVSKGKFKGKETSTIIAESNISGRFLYTKEDFVWIDYVRKLFSP